MKKIFIYLFNLIFLCSCALPAKHNLKRLTNERDCRNVRIVRGHAIAACGNILIIENLKTNKRKEFSMIDSKKVEADDIAVAGDFLFTISMNDHLKMYDILSPMEPVFIDDREDVPVQLYTGIDAHNGLIVTSGGLRDSHLIRYTTKGFRSDLVMVPAVENYTGRPDVIIWKSKKQAELRLIYSLDVNLAYKWGIQIVEFENEHYLSKKLIELESGFSPILLGDYQPTNFPLTALQIKNELYYSHWKTQSIYKINLKNKNAKEEIVYKSRFVITHMDTDGKSIFMTNKDKSHMVYKLNLKTKKLQGLKSSRIVEPMGIAVKDGYVAVADKINGLITLKH